MSLCKYKNIFGKPGKGLHKYNIGGIAVVDVIMTIILGIIITKITKGPFIIILMILFLFGIICHRVFCVKTTVDKFLFSN